MFGFNTVYVKPITRDFYFQMATWCYNHQATIIDEGDHYRIVEIPEPEPEPIEDTYAKRVSELIREKYSQDDECAILRKKLAGIDAGEFDEYNVYCEGCKIFAKTELGLIEPFSEMDKEVNE